jgi:hypothetical protein
MVKGVERYCATVIGSTAKVHDPTYGLAKHRGQRILLNWVFITIQSGNTQILQFIVLP